MTAPNRWSDAQVAALIAQDIPAGSYVNLGIGLPTLVASEPVAKATALFHAENGVIGIVGVGGGIHAHPDLIDAGKNPAGLAPGAAFFSHCDSFAMIRSGRIDIAILGAYEVSEHGDLANWSTGAPEEIPAVGGAMDLAYGAREVWVMCRHQTRSGRPKVVDICSYPLTGKRCVTRIYTDAAQLRVTDVGLVVERRAPGLTAQELAAATGCRLVDTLDDRGKDADIAPEWSDLVKEER